MCIRDRLYEGVSNRMTAAALMRLAHSAGVPVFDVVADQWITDMPSWEDLQQHDVSLQARVQSANAHRMGSSSAATAMPLAAASGGHLWQQMGSTYTRTTVRAVQTQSPAASGSPLKTTKMHCACAQVTGPMGIPTVRPGFTS